MYLKHTFSFVVGFGDITAVTEGGRVLACLTAFCGVVFVALPICLVAANFNKLYKKFFVRHTFEREEMRFINDPNVGAAERRKRRKSLQKMHANAEKGRVIVEQEENIVNVYEEEFRDALRRHVVADSDLLVKEEPTLEHDSQYKAAVESSGGEEKSDNLSLPKSERKPLPVVAPNRLVRDISESSAEGKSSRPSTPLSSVVDFFFNHQHAKAKVSEMESHSSDRSSSDNDNDNDSDSDGDDDEIIDDKNENDMENDSEFHTSRQSRGSPPPTSRIALFLSQTASSRALRKSHDMSFFDSSVDPVSGRKTGHPRAASSVQSSRSSSPRASPPLRAQTPTTYARDGGQEFLRQSHSDTSRVESKIDDGPASARSTDRSIDLSDSHPFTVELVHVRPTKHTIMPWDGQEHSLVPISEDNDMDGVEDTPHKVENEFGISPTSPFLRASPTRHSPSTESAHSAGATTLKSRGSAEKRKSRESPVGPASLPPLSLTRINRPPSTDSNPPRTGTVPRLRASVDPPPSSRSGVNDIDWSDDALANRINRRLHLAKQSSQRSLLGDMDAEDFSDDDSEISIIRTLPNKQASMKLMSQYEKLTSLKKIVEELEIEYAGLRDAALEEQPSDDLARKSRGDKSIYEKIYDFFDCVLLDSLASTFGAVVVYSAVLLGVTAFVIATLPGLRYSPSSCPNPACDNDPNLCPNVTICEPIELPFFITINIVCVAVYSVDYAIRLFLCWAVPEKTNFVTRYWFETPSEERDEPSCSQLGHFKMNPNFNRVEFYIRYIVSIRSLVDLACIVPAFVELAYLTSQRSSSSTFVRVLRIFRVFRVFKLLLASKKIRNMLKLIGLALHQSRDALILMMLTSLTLSVFFGSILFTVEKGVFVVSDTFPDGYYRVPTVNQYSTQQSLFESAMTGIYAAVITLTTVGYGDVVPTTALGRIIICAMELLATMLLSLPVGVIGANFLEVYKANERKINMKFKVNLFRQTHNI